jgi:FolB domain-containing protein
VDLIEIERLRLRCVLGISDEERRDRQDVVIDLTIGTDTRSAVNRDTVESVWNYRTATKAVIELVEPSAYQTVERLVEEIARLIVVGHRAAYVRVRVHKPGALRFADSVGLVIERRAEDYSSDVIAAEARLEVAR